MSVSDRVRNVVEETLHEGWSRLTRATFDYRRSDGRVERMTRESYDRGDGAAILLYDPERRTVVLVRQFRWPAYSKADEGFLLEAPAGQLDAASPETRILAEAEEETGFRPHEAEKVFEAFMSPGSVTERLHFFVARYRPEDRISPGGGAEDEGEDIEVVEIDIDEALTMIGTGAIRDAKTIMLLQHAALRLFAG